jgi:diguanylate cyclase (GGDEF)-like protein/PAS domain S-box-containing protein
MTTPDPAATGKDAAGDYRHAQTTVMHLAVVGLVLTSLFVGGLATWLLHKAQTGRIDHGLHAALQLQAAALGAEISQLQNIAVQVTSRTRIRQELERHLAGSTTLQAFRQFTGPKLHDALKATDAGIGVTRFSVNGSTLVEVGQVIPPLMAPDFIDTSGPSIGLPQDGSIAVSAPIRDQDQRTIGYDVVLFDDRRLRQVMRGGSSRFHRGNLMIAALQGNTPTTFYRQGDGEATIDKEQLGLYLIELDKLGRDLDTHDVGGDSDLFVVGAPVEGTHWVLMFYAERANLYAVANRQSMVVAGMIVVLVALGILLTNRAMQPLVNRLSTETRSLQRLLNQNEALLAQVTAKEAKLQAVLDNAPAIIYIKDRDGRYTLVNSSYEHLVHLPRDEIVGKFDYQLFPEEIAKSTRDTDLEVLRTNHSISVDEYLNRPDGRHDFLSTKFPLRDSEGQVYAVCGIATEITQRKSVERRLALTQTTIDHATFGVFWALADGSLIYANDIAMRQMGLARSQLSNLHVCDLFCDLERTAWTDHWQRLKQHGTLSYQSRQRRPNGGDYPAEIHAFHLAHDGIDYCIAVIHDISERHATEQKLRQSATVFDSTNEAIVITDASGVVVDVNPAFTEMLGYRRAEAVGQRPSLWKSNIHDNAFYQDMWRQLAESGQWRGEILNRHKNGSIIPELVSINAVFDDQAQAANYVAVCTDIRQLKESQERLAHLAHHDALTALPNRVLFQERVQHSLNRAARRHRHVAIIFIDLDHFKDVNDSLGHSAGDELLKAAAKLLCSVLRKDDTVARIGGDEFTVLIEDVADRNRLAAVVEKILDAFDCEFDLGEAKVRMSPSLGISVSPEDGEDADTLMRNADAAMYRAKSLGRNTYQFYTEELTRLASERMRIDNALRKALNANEFHLLYQPQIDLRSGKVVGMEALLRWHSAELGFVPPDQFIPIAENNGLIIPLGRWVLEQACRQAKVWLDRGLLSGTLAVNVSGIQVRRGDLVETVTEVLAKTAFPADHLELEVTEGFIMGETEQAVDVLDRLRALGLTLAVDDFGTGYSSLSYLKSLPIHRLKIDKSFIRDIPDDQDDVAITRAVIALGRSLGLGLVAEGVETAIQHRFLLDEGCVCAQGYLFHRPLSSDDIESLLAASAPARQVN